MPDTKSGRERKGRNKRRQLERHLNRRELAAADEPPEPTLDDLDDFDDFDDFDTEYLSVDETAAFDW